MVPLPDSLVTPVVVQLQLFVSSLGVGLLHLAGLPVYREGNVIHLPGGESLFVAEACSGITSIITLPPLAVFYAYFTERRWGRQLVLVAAVVPLAMLANLVRVIATVIASGYVGTKAATGGPLHETAGVFTYVLGLLALMLIGSAMRRLAPEPAAAET